jgi:hypothetical protein
MLILSPLIVTRNAMTYHRDTVYKVLNFCNIFSSTEEMADQILYADFMFKVFITS